MDISGKIVPDVFFDFDLKSVRETYIVPDL